MKLTNPKLAAKFWSRVDMRSHRSCWPWLGDHNAKGYSRLTIDYKDWKAHRVAWMLTFQRDIPEGQVVMHRCDNPDCVNPSHLSIGTHRDNSLDAKLRGRKVGCGKRNFGERHRYAKLTDDAVRDIRANTTVSQRTLAEKYGVDKSAIGKVRRGQRWTHVTPAP